jgi:UDP-glucose 4-epimerase
VHESVREIVVLDNFVRGRRETLAWAAEHAPVTVVEGDIRDRALVSNVMAGIDVVFHQAAIRITQCAEEPELAIDVLINGTYAVLDAAVKARVRKVVAASSASVYGLADRFPTDERHHPYNNRTLWRAKLFNEGCSGPSTISTGRIRACAINVCGPRMDVMAPTPKSSSGGWSCRGAADHLRRRSQTMDFVRRYRGPTSWRGSRSDNVQRRHGIEISLELAEAMTHAMGATFDVERAPACRESAPRFARRHVPRRTGNRLPRDRAARKLVRKLSSGGRATRKRRQR